MNYKFLSLLFLLLTGTAHSQCCCGHFYFRIYDPVERKIYPQPGDTKLLNIDPNEKEIGAGSPAEAKNLGGDFSVRSLLTEGNAGTAAISLLKYPFTDLLMTFSTGCSLKLKRISIKKKGLEMILNLTDIPADTEIMMDSILFAPGEYTYNIRRIIGEKKLPFIDNGPEQHLYLHYAIPHQVLPLLTGSVALVKKQAFVIPYPLHEVIYYPVPDVKNDTSFYYYNIEKTQLLCKGQLISYRKKCPRFSSEEKQFREHKRHFFPDPCRRDYKYGTWYFYDQQGRLALISHFKKKRKIRFRKNTTVPAGTWRYFDKDGNIILIETYSKGKLLNPAVKPKSPTFLGIDF